MSPKVKHKNLVKPRWKQILPQSEASFSQAFQVQWKANKTPDDTA